MRENKVQIRSNSLKAALLILMTANVLNSSPSLAYKDWGKLKLFLPNSATKQERYIASLAAEGKIDQALALTNSAINKERDISGLLLMRIKLYEATEQEEKIEADFKKLISLPLESDELFHAINLADQLEEIETGILLGQRYLKEYGTTTPNPLIVLARFYSRERQYDKAEKTLLLILDKPGMADFTYTDLSRLYVCSRQPEKLIAASSKALKNPQWFSPKSLMILHTLRGQAYLETKKFKEALDDYNYLVAKAPSQPQIYNLRAQAYAGLGQNQLAEADRKKQKAVDQIDH